MSWLAGATVAGLLLGVGVSIPASAPAAGGALGAAARRGAGRPHVLRGGTVYFAEPPKSAPDFIFPFMSSRFYDLVNTADFQHLMYRPLYWFGDDGSAALDPDLSLASPPVWSDGDRAVTITLKSYRWSDGEPVSAEDIAFWLNLDKVEKLAWAGYTPGALPDDITSVRLDSPASLTIGLSAPVNESWFTYDELSQITPFPLAWDVAGSGRGAGAQACASASWSAVRVEENRAGTGVTPLSASAKSCAAVYDYLEQQSGYDPSAPGAPNNALAGYATDKLWEVVDGPFQLSSFDPSGKAVLLPNRDYSGPVKATISQLVELPYSSPAAELQALDAGQLTVGYLPTADITAPAPSPTTAGPNDPHLRQFRIAAWYAYGVGDVALNFASAGDGGNGGALLSQLYFRQALQSLVDEPAEITSAFAGYALPSYGPVPVEPSAPFVSASALRNAYPYDPAHAVALLRSHGWTVRPGATSVCADARRCGVPRGTAASVGLLVPAGQPELARLAAGEQASFARAGIVLEARLEPPGSAPSRCSGDACTWMAALPAQPIDYVPDYYPSGQQLFATAGALNLGSFSDAGVDALIGATVSGSSDLTRYDTALATLLPVIWEPLPVYQITEVRVGLSGVTPQNPYLGITPEAWRLTAS